MHHEIRSRALVRAIERVGKTQVEGAVPAAVRIERLLVDGVEALRGLRVALSADGNALAASAIYEASAGRGINARQDDDSAPEAGAVYLFERSGSTWTFWVPVNARSARSNANTRRGTL